MLRRFAFRADNALFQVKDHLEILCNDIEEIKKILKEADIPRNINRTKNIDEMKFKIESLVKDILGSKFSKIIDNDIDNFIQNLDKLRNLKGEVISEKKDNIIKLRHKIYFDTYAYNDAVEKYNYMLEHYMTKIIGLTHGYKTRNTILL
jgi:uncharacterized protein YbcC (UPF0753/DUF2309 family)